MRNPEGNNSRHRERVGPAQEEKDLLFETRGKLLRMAVSVDMIRGNSDLTELLQMASIGSNVIFYQCMEQGLIMGLNENGCNLK